MTARALGVVLLGAVVAVGVRGSSVPAAAPRPVQRTDDAAQASRLLRSVRGSGPVVCELALRTLGFGWGWGSRGQPPDADADAREMLRWTSRRPSDPGAVPVLRRGLEDPDRCVRRTAARVLGRLRHPAAVRSLLGALEASEPTTRAMAAVGLGYAEDRSTVEPLLGALGDRSPAVRAAAAWAVGEIEDPRGIAPLARLLRRDIDPAVRRQAAFALGRMY